MARLVVVVVCFGDFQSVASCHLLKQLLSATMMTVIPASYVIEGNLDNGALKQARIIYSSLMQMFPTL